jgi:hypothetical protein
MVVRGCEPVDLPPDRETVMHTGEIIEIVEVTTGFY